MVDNYCFNKTKGMIKKIITKQSDMILSVEYYMFDILIYKMITDNK